MVIWPHDDDDNGVEMVQWCTHVLYLVQVFLESGGLISSHAKTCLLALDQLNCDTWETCLGYLHKCFRGENCFHRSYKGLSSFGKSLSRI